MDAPPLEGPTRGNLAGDRAAVEEFTTAMAHEFDGAVDPAQDRTKLLVLADVAGARVAVAARYNDDYASILLSRTPLAPRRDGPDGPGSLGGMAGGLTPFFHYAGGVHQSQTVVDHVATVVLAPAGCTVESSDQVTIADDGTAFRGWTLHGDHLIEEGERNRSTWWRVTCDGQVRYEGSPTLAWGPGKDTPDPVTPARGGAEPVLVGAALDEWRNSTRHLGGTAPSVLWAGPSGEGRSTVVVAGPGRDGRLLVTALTGPPPDFAGPGLDKDVRPIWPVAGVYYAGHEPYTGEPPPDTTGSTMVIPATLGTATAASADLVAVRLPADQPVPVLGDRILVVAPPSATELRYDGKTVRLTDGVGVLTLPAPVGDVTLTAVDATGAVVATARYGEPDADGQFFGQRVIDDWDR